MVKKVTAIVGAAGLIPGSGRFPGEGNGFALQYPYLGCSKDKLIFFDNWSIYVVIYISNQWGKDRLFNKQHRHNWVAMFA